MFYASVDLQREAIVSKNGSDRLAAKSLNYKYSKIAKRSERNDR